ncbi:MAG: hypothetical protein ACYC3X_09460 [Pirellulaceae bacterium]
MARLFRLWEKKRGDRRTGSQFVGGLGEALFFSVLFLLGSLSLAYLVASHFGGAPASVYRPGFGFWVMVLVMVSFMLIGGGGVIYTVLQVGTSAERRSAMARRAADMNPLNDSLPSHPEYPTIPRDANLTNSPGIRLPFRLPVTHAGPWVLFAATAFFLVWNGIATVLVLVAVKSHISQHPDWFLTLFVLPFVGIGMWATYYFVQQLMLHTGIGPTTVEISDHPLVPGRTYQLFVSQAGRLNVQSLEVSLVCEEEATYRQGTDIRTERCRVVCESVFVERDFRTEPGKAFERECELHVPDHVMHSFQARHNAVQWMLVAKVQAASWPMFQRCFPVVVGPAEPRKAAG